MKKIDLLTLSDLDQPTIEQLAARADELAHCWNSRTMPQTLSGARVGSITELPGWRNPTALALGVAAMGGTNVNVTAKLEGRETMDDLAGYMDNWFDLLAVRTPSLSRLRTFAESLDAPVMNMRTNDNHPCEVLGDLAFVHSSRGSWEGLRVAVVGQAGNIARSWFEAAETLPIEVVQIAPPSLMFAATDCGPRKKTSDDPRMIEDADLIITDCWPSAPSDEEKAVLTSFSINAALLDRCRPDVLFIPCPPVTRGEEVASSAMRHPRCLATPAKSFLMHVQNAFIEGVL